MHPSPGVLARCRRLVLGADRLGSLRKGAQECKATVGFARIGAGALMVKGEGIACECGGLRHLGKEQGHKWRSESNLVARARDTWGFDGKKALG